MNSRGSSVPVLDSSRMAERWTETWISNNTYTPDLDSPTKPFYNLMMFPYPSAEGLHVGNMYAFSGADIYGRYKRMRGFDVFEPIGLDGFGIHSENYAIKIGKHPAEQAKISQERFYNQLLSVGNGFAWDHRLETYDPSYYKWTQWFFIQMFNHGLAEKKSSKVNWCPSCKTVLSDEQVEQEACERCGSIVERKTTEQWFFTITKYAENLLQGISDLNWPKKIKIAQQNWIGKKQGAIVKFVVSSAAETYDIECFTTRLDTIFGVSFLVVSPEKASSLLSLVPQDRHEEVQAYIKKSLNKTEQQRKMDEKEKSGVFMGISATHPLTSEEIPVYVADYVLEGYGTGSVMGVPAHDERDCEFAVKYELPSKQVIVPDGESSSESTELFVEYGKLIESEKYSGLSSEEAIEKILAEHQDLITKSTQYHLRDWLISRQRYWGPPIPMVKCDAGCGSHGGWHPVPEDQLPVLLPEIQEYLPTGDGKSPLQRASQDWLVTTCPACGGTATRETDVSDTFLDSSWYFLRYLSLGSSKTQSKTLDTHPFDSTRVKTWLPVHAYIGGAEHAVLHLLYARFFGHVLHDWGYLDAPEPFPFLFGHGLIIKDGTKMSKSKGNIVNPDEYIKKYGADTLRLYLMFLGPYDQGGDFRDTGIAGMHRWLNKVWTLMHTQVGESSSEATQTKLHLTIQKCTQDMEQFKYNTAIASMMEFANVWQKEGSITSGEAEMFLKLLAPFAPFIAEELYHSLFDHGENESIHTSSWPEFDSRKTRQSLFEVVIQLNGKRRAVISLPEEEAGDKARVQARAIEELEALGVDLSLMKNCIVVPRKIVNVVL